MVHGSGYTSLARPSQRLRSCVLPLATALLGCLVALIALAHLARSAVVIPQPWEVMYGEAIIHDHAARLLRAEPLYQPLGRPPYSVAAYTPLYYGLAAGLQAVVGPGFAPGRLLSLLAGLAAACLVASLAARRTGDRRAGWFAGLLFLALGLPGAFPFSSLPAPYPSWLKLTYPYYPWMALYKEDVLGVALSVGAIVALLGGPTTRRVIVGATLASLAVLTKQTLIAPGLAGVLWLWRRDRRRAAIFGGTGLVIVLGTSATLELATGAFVINVVLVNANPFGTEPLASNLGMLALFQAGPIAVALLYLLERARHRRAAEDELLALYWGATLLPLVGLAKVGSNHNHWIEFAAATSALATLGLWAGLRHWPVAANRAGAAVPFVLLGLHVAAVAPLVDTAALRSPRTLAPDPERVVAFAALVERVRMEPAAVLANPLDVVTLAGRPALLEPYIFSILESEGRWDSGPLIERICAGDVGLLVVDYPIELSNTAFHGHVHWPWPIFEVLEAAMTPRVSMAERYLYTPRPPGAVERCART